MDLRGFDVRVIPHTAAKAQQQVLSLRGTMSWLYQVLQDGRIGNEGSTFGYGNSNSGHTIAKDHAYECYKEFSKQRRECQPEIKDLWSKKIRAVLGSHVDETRPAIAGNRVRSFAFAPLADCR